MQILAVVQGRYGQRIVSNIRQRALPGWAVSTWVAPPVLPPVIDYPEEYLPDSLAPAQLILSLGEHPGVAEFLPDLASMTGAQAVIAPVDNLAWLPPGLMNQLAGWLAEIGVPAVFPKPFCSLTETHYNAYRNQVAYDIPLVSQFARTFGRPQLQMRVAEGDKTITDVEVVRDAACGCALHVAQGLVGLSVEDAEHAAGMLHHHYPCLASMAVDPAYADTLMHVSGNIMRDEVSRCVQPYKQPPVYLRPSGRSD